MFGFSLSKLLLTAFIVVMVWLIFKKIGEASRRGRPQESRADRIRRTAEETVRNAMGQPPRPDEAKTVDMIKCPSCGNWIAAGGTCSCGYRDKS